VSTAEVLVDGDRCVVLESKDLRIAVDVDYGAHLFELVDVRSGTNLLHRDPRGPRHHVVGGWFELFPNAGGACEHAGHRLTRAGDIRERRWTHRIVDDETVELTTRSADLPLGLTKTLRLSADTLLVTETVTNLSEEPQQLLWGQHITFGAPFLTAAWRLDLPAAVFHTAGIRPPQAPYAADARGPLSALPTEDGGTVDLTRFPAERFNAMVISEPLPEHWYNVWADDLAAGLTVSWDGETYPVLWLWATRNGHGLDTDAVACAVEPQSSPVPGLDKAAAAGTALSLAPRASRTSWVRTTLHHDPAPVTGVGPAGAPRRA
jgi:galactose mutarotase-like enzyme